MQQPPIHPSAIIEPGAVLGAGVTVGAFSIIRSGAILGAGCRIASHVVIKGCVTLAERVEVDSFSVLGGDPQDLAFDTNRKSGVSIGMDTKLREGVTIHRATKEGADTVVGADCLLMGNSHVAHDAMIGARVVLANGALIAGHVRVGDNAFVSGNTCIHQHCRIGEGAMVAAGAVLTEDLPPQGLASERNRLSALNVIGMRRRGVSSKSVADVRACYRRVYLSAGMNLSTNAIAARKEGLGSTPEGASFLDFFADDGKRRRVCRPKRGRKGESVAVAEAE